MIALAIKGLTGQGPGEILQEKLFEPLGMSRISTRDIPNNFNCAKVYMTLNDGSPFEVQISATSDQAVMAADGCV